MTDLIRIFIGAAANNEDIESQAVLEYTIRKYASRPVEIVWMQLSRNPASPFFSAPEKGKAGGWVTDSWATPFSGFRWAVPHLINFVGKAIYMDSDFIVRADIAELWDRSFEPEKAVIATNPARLDCCCWNGEVVKRHHYRELEWLMREANAHRNMITHYERNARAVQVLPPTDNWNMLDIQLLNKAADLNAPSIKAIHYTGIPTQLQLKHALPRLKASGQNHWYDRPTRAHPLPALQELFDQELEAAIKAGFPPSRYIRKPYYGRYAIRGKAA